MSFWPVHALLVLAFMLDLEHFFPPFSLPLLSAQLGPAGQCGQSIYTVQWSQGVNVKEKLPISLWKTCFFPLVRECSPKHFILKRKMIYCGQIRNVWEANVSFCPFSLKMTKPTAEFWILGENLPNFEEKYWLIWQKCLLASLFS